MLCHGTALHGTARHSTAVPCHVLSHVLVVSTLHMMILVTVSGYEWQLVTYGSRRFVAVVGHWWPSHVFFLPSRGIAGGS